MFLAVFNFDFEGWYKFNLPTHYVAVHNKQQNLHFNNFSFYYCSIYQSSNVKND